jgi:hypothetical protein
LWALPCKGALRPKDGRPPLHPFSSAGRVRGAERGAGANERSHVAGALSQTCRSGGHAFARRACLRNAQEPLHWIGKNSAPAGLHRCWDERCADSALARWMATRQNAGDPFRSAGVGHLNSPTVSDLSEGPRPLGVSVPGHRPRRQSRRHHGERAPRHGGSPSLCRSYDKLSNFLRLRTRHNQPVHARRRRLLHLRRATAVLAILDAA